MKTITHLYLQLPKRHQLILLCVVLVSLILLFIPTEQATASKASRTSSLEVGKRYSLALPDSSDDSALVSPEEEEQENLTWKLAKVNKGDSLAKILAKHQISARITYLIGQNKLAKQHIVNLNVGDEIRLAFAEDNQLRKLVYPINTTDTLTVELQGDEVSSAITTKEVDIQLAFTAAEIDSNFWNAGIQAGMQTNQIMSLANIFGWDIDFALDIREGDTFSVVYEKRYIDGEYVGDGEILAAEFVNQDERYVAIRFDDGEYYAPDGSNLRKSFLRAPVNFKYISSSFKPKRFHPILKRWKAHNGVDYRANTGTPVVAAGSGKVTHSTYNKYNGHYVFIQHGDGIVTKYLHFSKRAVKQGQRVKQGDIIGYVGATGLAEAPHLHYEFLVNGTHRNPRTVKLPRSKPIDKKHQQAFAALSDERVAQLNSTKRSLLARN